MDPSRFKSAQFGTVRLTPGPHGFFTYFPTPIPRSLALSEQTIGRLSEADRALGRLAGAGRLLPNPQLLVNAYIRREAVASSRIEGTQATIAEVFQAEAGGPVGGDIQEVLNYIRAMDTGLERLATLPLSRRLTEEIHAVLLRGIRGHQRNPGEVRRSPNWIGSPDNRPETAVFVPPPVDEMEEGLSDWERFLHERIEMPPLIRCALMHYQFETLHPFLDGNGRLGRLLIVFFLISEQHLPAPLLYLSSYFDDHKEDYYDRLQAVRERGQIDEWLRFFLVAVAAQAGDAVSRAEKLTDLREAYRGKLHGSRSRAHEIIDMVLENPFVTTVRVSNRLGITGQGATNLLRQLQSLGVLRLWPRLPGRSSRWVAHEVLAVLSGEGPPLR
jgi:Fic family protein